MKKNTEIICTIVPRGTAQKNLFAFSVFLTPKLYQSGTLRLYDEIKQWHQYREFFTNNKRLKVKFGKLDNDGQQMTISPLTLFENVAYQDDIYKTIINNIVEVSKDVVIWEQLFDGATPVKGWSEDQQVNSENLYPLYRTGASGPAGRSLSADSTIENLESLAKSLAHSESFEDLRKKMCFSEELLANKENQEFHTKMSILADYPHLLRLLGWIYDFSFQLTGDEEVKTTFDSSNLIQIIIEGFEPTKTNDSIENTIWDNFTNYVTFISPWTYFDPNSFTMKYKDDQPDGNPFYLVKDGFLKSKSSVYEIKASQLDMKRMIQKYIESESNKETTELALTDSLSSTGIALVVQNPTNQQLPLEAAVDSKPALAELNDPIAPGAPVVKNYVLFGHHLDTGYRIDVVAIEKVVEKVDNITPGEEIKTYVYTYQTKDGKIDFYSLCRRSSDYFIDKNYLSEHLPLFQNYEDEPWVAESAQLGASGKLYFDEELCRWNNWSLTCPQLGDYPQDEEEDVVDKFYNDIELVNIKPIPGSLLPLRFGKRYAFRIRIVDICGNGKSLKDSSPPLSEGQPDPDYLIYSDGAYQRFEPVDPPGIYFKHGDDTNLESLETMVLKTIVEGDQLIYGQACVRVVAPPKANLQFIESHGVLDSLLKQGINRNEIYDKAAYLPTVPEDYAVSNQIPFLTDPCCQGFSVTIENFSSDNMQEEITEWNTSGTEFLNRQFISLTVLGDKVKEEEIDKNEEGVTIFIKPGSIYDISLLSAIQANPASYEPTYYDASNTPLPVNIFHPLLQEGKKNITAPLKIKILHAVQKPVVRRVGRHEVFFRQSYFITLNVADRKPLAPILIKFSELQFESIPDINARCFPISTSGEFILEASSYNIVIDNAENKGYTKELIKVRTAFSNFGHEGKLKLDDDYDAERFLNEINGFEHSFGDAQYRRVKYTIKATSRFKEYFPEKDLDALQVVGEVQEEVIIKSANLPEAPVIHSIVPIFTWTPKGTSITREQNTFRIYFEGDWYSSGPEEKVAILFLQDKNSIEEHYQGIVSEYGKDPTTKGIATTGLTKAFFQSENIVGTGESDRIDYRLLGKRISPDSPNGTTMVTAASPDESLLGAIFEVGFDKEAKRFYSDIVLILEKETAHYNPFLKLALSRYQEYSIQQKDQYDYRFSPVVMAPSVQLLPTRKVAWKDPFHLNTLEVSPTKQDNELYVFLEKEYTIEAPELGIPNGEPKVLRWEVKNNATLEDYNLVTVEEYEQYEAGPPNFIMAESEEVTYSPRNDIRKRLVFSYQHKINISN